MKERIPAHLHDIVQAGHAIRECISGRTWSKTRTYPETSRMPSETAWRGRDSRFWDRFYASDELLRNAVERKVEIVGEALNRIRRLEPEMLQHIRDRRDIASFRNILVHGHGVTDDHMVWGVMEEDLDTLPEDVGKLILYGSRNRTSPRKRARGGRAALP